MLDFFEQYKEIFLYLSIPLTSAIVGWGTNVLALKMTFYPIEFIGIKPFGWQGIIPSKAKKMSGISVDLWTTKLIDVQELFSQIDPEIIAEEMRPEFDKLSKEIMDEIMVDQSPEVWKRIPESAKKVVYARISRDMPHVVKGIMQDVKENIEDVFDIKGITVNTTYNGGDINKHYEEAIRIAAEEWGSSENQVKILVNSWEDLTKWH